MGLEDLIAGLEAEPVTSVTSKSEQTYQEKPSNIKAVTPVTPVTPEKKDSEGRFRDTPPKRGPNPPAPGGLVARIIEAGGRSSIGGFRPDRSLYRTAELPEDAPAELVAELERERWHVARILKAARRATPRPDHDPAEWIGEFEDETR